MTYNIFLDDERRFHDVTWIEYKNAQNFVVVRTVEEFVEYIENFGPPNFISFDHDLGTVLSGLDAAKKLIEIDMDQWNGSWNGQYCVHSKNPIGEKNIDGYIKSYLRSKE
jgi:hypothetical protein